MAFFIWISPEVILTLITLTSSKTWLTSTLSIKLKIYSTDSAGYMCSIDYHHYYYYYYYSHALHNDISVNDGPHI